MQDGEMALSELRGLAERIAEALSPTAEDRSSSASYGYRIARGQALALADLLAEIGDAPGNLYASPQR